MKLAALHSETVVNGGGDSLKGELLLYLYLLSFLV